MPTFGAVSELPVSTLPDAPAVSGDSPPLRTAAALMGVILASWPTGAEYPTRQDRVQIAPLTLATGDQPPPTSRTTPQWPADPWPQQRQSGVAPLIPAPVVQQTPYTPYPFSILAAWQEAYTPQQRRTQIATLTLATGNEPP